MDVSRGCVAVGRMLESHIAVSTRLLVPSGARAAVHARPQNIDISVGLEVWKKMTRVIPLPIPLLV